MIRIELPPNFHQIQKAFPNAIRRGVIFAYNGDIYNPSGVFVHKQLVAHEEMHLARQEVMGTYVWWGKYIDDAEFRYIEELHGHAAELRNLLKNPRIANRNSRFTLLNQTAHRLIAPLYNYDPPRTLKQATSDLMAFT